MDGPATPLHEKVRRREDGPPGSIFTANENCRRRSPGLVSGPATGEPGLFGRLPNGVAPPPEWNRPTASSGRPDPHRDPAPSQSRRAGSRSTSASPIATSMSPTTKLWVTVSPRIQALSAAPDTGVTKPRLIIVLGR